MADRTTTVSERLAEHFPPTALKTRSGGGGKQLTYVEGHTVIRRLIDATGNAWNLSVDKIDRLEIDASNALMVAHVTLEIPGLGRRSHIGVQAVNARSGEDLVKGAITDALKKAATLFGVGLELYGPDYEAGELDVGEPHNGQQLPPRGRSEGQNTVPQAGPGGITEKQMGMIRKLAEEKGLEPDDVRAMHGKASAKDLSRQEASALIDALMAL